jgi:hypothetical protein
VTNFEPESVSDFKGVIDQVMCGLVGQVMHISSCSCCIRSVSALSILLLACGSSFLPKT